LVLLRSISALRVELSDSGEAIVGFDALLKE
jgi:hypothetical protein